MLYLRIVSECSGIQIELYHAFVALVPARKNIISNAKGRLHGCTAWATAVRAAATMPAGVRDWRDHARYTKARVAGTATMAFIFVLISAFHVCCRQFMVQILIAVLHSSPIWQLIIGIDKDHSRHTNPYQHHTASPFLGSLNVNSNPPAIRGIISRICYQCW